MSWNTKNPAGGPGFSENALSQNNKEKSNTKPLALPKKSEIVIASFLQNKDLNTFEANNSYGDTCLHSAVSTLEKKHGITFRHEPESVINRIGKKVRVTRYHLLDIEKAQRLHLQFKRERGIDLEAAQ